MSSVSPADEIAHSRANPYKRNLLVRRLTLAPWWLLVILMGILLFAVEVSDQVLYKNAWQEVQTGLVVTIRVTIIAYLLSLLMGLLIAILRRPSGSVFYNLFVYQPITVYVEVIRGIPTLVLMFYIVLALVPQMVSWGNSLGADLLQNNINHWGIGDYLATLRTRDISNEYRAIAALAISYSAFISEIFRAGLESIDQGQRDAAKSIGLDRWQIMRFIILPQAIRNILPPLGNDFIALLKESSLVSVVGVADITREGRDFNASTFTLFAGYNVIAVTYLGLTLSLSMLVKSLEWYLGRGRNKSA